MCHVEKDSTGAFIRTGFWTAPRRQQQSRDDTFHSLYVLTCPERNAIGLFPIHFGEAAGRIGGDTDQLIAAHGRLVEHREISMNGYWILVRNWWDHNHKPGPGHCEKIARALADAPEALRVEWELIARDAGVYPFRWPEDGDSKRAEPGGTTQGGTRGGMGGNNNDKNNGNGKFKKTTTTRRTGKAATAAEVKGSDVESAIPYEDIAFPAQAAEVHREEFARVCLAEILTQDEAQQLALELSARVENDSERPEHRIEHHEPWMTGVVRKARSAGAPILRKGVKYKREAEERVRRVAARAAEATALLLEREKEEQENDEVVRLLQDLDEAALAKLSQEVDRLFPPSTGPKPRQRLRASIEPVRFPLPEWGVRFLLESSSRVLEGRAVTTMTRAALQRQS